MPAPKGTAANTHYGRSKPKSTGSSERRLGSGSEPITHTKKAQRNSPPPPQKELLPGPAPPVPITAGERGRGRSRRTAASRGEGGGCQPSEGRRARGPAPSAPHFAPALGEQTTSPRGPGRGGAGTRSGPCPRAPASGSRVLGGPGSVTSGDRAARGAGGRLRVPGKLARASSGRARKVTHRNGPESSVLRPRPLREKLLRRRQPPSSLRLSCRRCRRRRSLGPPGVAGTGGDVTTSLLGDFRSMAVPIQLGKSERNPLSQQPPRTGPGLLGIVVSRVVVPLWPRP